MTLPILSQQSGPGGSLMEGLGMGIQQALPSIQEMIVSHSKKKQQSQLLSQLGTQMGQERGTGSGGSNALQTMLSMAQAGIDPNIISSISPFLLSQHKQNMKTQGIAQEEEKTKGKVGGILDELEANKGYVGSTKVPWSKSFNAHEGGLNRSGIQKRKYIDTLAFDIERILRKENTKGALSGQVFNALMERIPNSKDSERDYQGKIDAFRVSLQGLPPKQRKDIEKRLDSHEAKMNSGKSEKPSLEEIFT